MYMNKCLHVIKTFFTQALVAPLDIEWVWHVHVLSPKKYLSDVKLVAGHVVPHRTFSEQERIEVSYLFYDLHLL